MISQRKLRWAKNDMKREKIKRRMVVPLKKVGQQRPVTAKRVKKSMMKPARNHHPHSAKMRGKNTPTKEGEMRVPASRGLLKSVQMIPMTQKAKKKPKNDPYLLPLSHAPFSHQPYHHSLLLKVKTSPKRNRSGEAPWETKGKGPRHRNANMRTREGKTKTIIPPKNGGKRELKRTLNERWMRTKVGRGRGLR